MSKFNRSLSAHQRQYKRYVDEYAVTHKEIAFAKTHYHFHVIDTMQKKGRPLTKQEKREIYRIKTDPRYR